MLKENSLLQASDISLRIGQRQLLNNVSLDIFQDETVTIIGPNGAGKTTLLRVLLGLVPSSSGHVITKKNLRIGYLPQKITVDPVLPLSVKRLMNLTGTYSDKMIHTALEETGVESIINSSVINLSGGEFQRVMLARALLRNPELLVLDEPVQNVDYLGETALYKLIGEIRKNHGCSILMISHDLHVVMASTDRVICLDQHICCHGEPCDISLHPEYLRLFGKGATDVLAVYNHQHDHSHDIHGNIKDESTAHSHHEGC